jgi:hypothetical protein
MDLIPAQNTFEKFEEDTFTLDKLQQIKDLADQQMRAKCYQRSRLVSQYLRKKLQKRYKIFNQFRKNFAHGNDSINLTDWTFVTFSPLYGLNPDEIDLTFRYVVTELQSVIDDLYGPKFGLEIKSTCNVFPFGLETGIYLFYDEFG